ncbi:MAG TPA: hypothetical protein VFJ60_02360 [Gaiella sp.]|nr:hypothetical protein [Gaiella sp.]
METASRKAPSSRASAELALEPPAREGHAGGRSPVLVLAGLVVLAAATYGTVAQWVGMPIVNPDELRYTLAAQGVVDGGWLNLRGHTYGYGPVYPLVLSPILWIAGSVDAAYAFFRVANALLFALAAVPVYLLARRLLTPWWSIGVALASVAVPSSIYTSLVMTESAAYLTASLALLSMVLALENPSAARQLGMLAAIALAFATRPQFAAFVPAFVVAWALAWGLEPARPRLRRAVTQLWPTFAAIGVLAATVLGARLLGTTSSAEDGVGGYSDLLRGYDLDEVAQFVAYHLAGWEVYLFVIPFVVAPIVVAGMVGAARRGESSDGAFVAIFLSVNAMLLLIAAAFASSPYGYQELHDRYLFYVAPLWLTAFAVWLSRGLPRPLLWTAVGATLALVLPAITPFGLIGGNIVFESVPTALWTWVWNTVDDIPHLDGRRVLGVVVLTLTLATVALPRRLWPVLAAVVLAGLLFGSILAWDREVDVPPGFRVADQGSRTWIDDALPRGALVTNLYLAPPECPSDELTREALFLAEFFNQSVDRVVHIGPTTPDGLPQDRVDLNAAGELVRTNGQPLHARYVVAPADLTLDGDRIATGSGANLILWRTEGVVTLGSPSRTELARRSCSEE